jgi:hypothetical protein
MEIAANGEYRDSRITGPNKAYWTCVAVPAEISVSCSPKSLLTPLEILTLEVGCEAQRKASGGPDGIAGEETAEVDYVQGIGQVLAIHLKSHFQAF